MPQKTLPTWDLSALYRSAQDRKISATTAQVDKGVTGFTRRYRGKVAKLAQKPTDLRRGLREYEELLKEAGKPLIYAQLLFAESCSDPKRGAFLQRMRSWQSRVEKDLLFFSLELIALDAAQLRRLAEDKALGSYANYLTQTALTKPHVLSEKEEQILNDKALTGREAFTRLFDEELSRKEFVLKEKGKARKCSEAEVLARLYHPSVSVRKAGAEAMTAGLREEVQRLAFIFNTLVEDKSLEDELRSYPYPEASRHLANQIDKSMVDAMESVVVKNYRVVQRFYDFKRKIMKASVLYDYDRYAPITRSEREIPFASAKNMVLDSFSAFSPVLGEIGREFFDRGWIDAAKRPGKRGGAFCSFGTPDTHPFVFINYTGNVRDVSTLAHELGHAIHAYLMRQQNYLNYDTPLTIAETASVFAEMLLFDHLRASLKSKNELLSLYVSKIESIIATVFRQISLYRFEQGLHEARRKKGELLVPEINDLWRKSQVEMFGKSITLSDNYSYWWSYIPHFIHTPFYVYAYAYGELLTLSLYAQYKSGKPGFIEKYIEFLGKGASQDPKGLLQPFGIRMNERRFWEGGIALIEEMVETAKGLR